MQFANSEYLWLFLIYIPLIVWYVYKQRNDHPTMALSTTKPFVGRHSLRASFRHSLFVLRLLAIGCLIMVLARPLLDESKRNQRTETSIEGTDIVLAIDVSASMLARDFKPNRIEAAKEVATKFVNGRPNDNIGLVVFAGESMTSLPMTLDHEVLVGYIDALNTDMISVDGTAIGDGIGTAINAISNGTAKSKSIIILTDGSNNTGLLTPRDAGQLAKERNIKVYTIGIGTRGMADYPYTDMFGRISYKKEPVVIDESILRDVSNMTHAKYFRATDKQVLNDVFTEIDQLEKTEMDVRHFTHNEDDPGIWPWLALAFFLLEITLRYTYFRTGP